MESLPTGLLFDILSRTSVADWVRVVPFVCRRWRLIVKQIWLQNGEGLFCEYTAEKATYTVRLTDGSLEAVSFKMHHEKFPKMPATKNETVERHQKEIESQLAYFVDKFGTTMKQFSSFQLTNGDTLSTMIVNNCPNLETVQFALGTGFTELANALGVLTKLVVIVYDMPKTNLKLPALTETAIFLSEIFIKCDTLRCVICDFYSMGTPDIRAFQKLQRLPKLEKIKWKVDTVDEKYLESLLETLISCSITLNTVHLSYIEMPDKGNKRWCQLFSLLAKRKLITELSLDIRPASGKPTTKLAKELVEALLKMSRLKRLSMNGFVCEDRKSKEDLRLLASQLETLDLRQNGGLDESFFDNFAYGIPALKELRTTCEESVPLECLRKFVYEKCPNLQLLDVHCTNLYSLGVFTDFVIEFHKMLHNCRKRDLRNEGSYLQVLFPNSDQYNQRELSRAKEHLDEMQLCGMQADFDSVTFSCTIFRACP